MVVMLHESPRCSLSLEPLMTYLAKDYCCIAFDTPGYGASDPLPQRFEPIDAFVDATLSAIDALGLKRFALYGTHTGGSIAVETALRVPERVTALVLDGYPAFTQEEQTSFLQNYLVPLTPKWDGSHIVETWSRVRDQAVFFPFYKRGPDTRLYPPVNDLDFLVRSAVGFLSAGDLYRDGYQAAITHCGAQQLRKVTTPTQLLVKAGDLIAEHLTRLEPKPNVSIHTEPLAIDTWKECIKDALTSEADTAQARALQQPQERRFLHHNDGMLYAAKGLGNTVGFQTQLPAPQSNAIYGLSKHMKGWNFYPPGIGPSSHLPQDMARKLISDELGLEQRNIPVPAASFYKSLPDLTRSFDGTFLMKAWFAVRDAMIFEHWSERAEVKQDIPTENLDDMSNAFLVLINSEALKRDTSLDNSLA